MSYSIQVTLFLEKSFLTIFIIETLSCKLFIVIVNLIFSIHSQVIGYILVTIPLQFIELIKIPKYSRRCSLAPDCAVLLHPVRLAGATSSRVPTLASDQTRSRASVTMACPILWPCRLVNTSAVYCREIKTRPVYFYFRIHCGINA